MRIMAIVLAVSMTGCNTAIVITMGARTNVHPPLIEKSAGSIPPCPTDDSRMAIVIVNRGKKTKGEK